jgi:hypothetical protein
MSYPVKLPGFEDREIVVEPAGFFSGPKLLVDGQPAPKGRGRGEMLVRRSDGKDVVFSFRSNFLDVPALMIDGKPLNLVEPLKWYEWVWNGLPLVLIVTGGALGGAIGVIAMSFNIKIFRSSQSAVLKYAVTAAVGAAAFVVYRVLALILAMLIQSN